jgi:FixJ family two-component response regulator
MTASAFLQKPFSAQKLLSAVEAFCTRRSRE